MWNKLSQVAGLTSDNEDEKEEKMSQVMDADHVQHQELLIQQLKDLVRENEKRFQDKSQEYDDLTSKFQKFKLQTKAKISHLSSQVKEQEKPGKKEDCDFDDTSSSDSSDQFQRGKVLLLKKQLNQAKVQLEKKEEESKNLVASYDQKITDLTLQLKEKNNIISSLADATVKDKSTDAEANGSPKKETNMQEMYAQIVYKDTKIMELNNQILELEKKIMDLQEHVNEKDEVLQQRNRAVQLMAEDLNRKGQTVVDELGDTREQMKIMQENFSSAESEWKQDLEKYKKRISELENDIMEFSKKLKENEMTVKSLETARSELLTKNADLQKKIVIVQESASKQCEVYNKEIGEEVESLKKSLEIEKQHTAELQKALDESNTQSNNKVLKARVNERTKFKALERELNELKKEHDKKPQEIIELQQKIAELEEEKGSLQLKLMEIEDQVTQLDKLKEENEALKDVEKEVLEKIKNYEEQIQTLREENEKWEIKFNVVSESYKEIEDKYNSSNVENNKLKEKVTEIISLKEKLENNNNELQKKFHNVKVLYEESLQNLQILRNQKVAFEMKSIELEEIRENDDKAKKELLVRIQQLEESFRDESKPDLQLERENLDLKDKLRQLENLCSNLREKEEKLSTEIDNLHQKLSEDKDMYSVDIKKLKDSITSLEETRNKLVEDLNSKLKENTEQAKLIKELENNFSCVKTDFSSVLSYFDAKDINDCKNYAIQKAEELSQMKNNLENTIKEKDDSLIHLNEKEEEIQQYCSKIKDLTLDIEQHKAQSQRYLETIQNLKDNIVERESDILKLSADIQEKNACIEASSQAFLKKSEAMIKLEEQERILRQELDKATETFASYKDKVVSNNSSLLGQISELENEIGTVRDELSSKTQMAVDFESNFLGMQSENLLLQNIIEELESTIDEMKTSLLSIEKENEVLTDTVDTKNAEISLLTQKVDQCMEELEIKNAEAVKFAHDLKLSNESIAALEESSRILKDKNTILEEEKLHSNRSLSEKDEVHQQVMSENMHLKTEINRMKEEKDALQKSLEETSDQLNQLNFNINRITKLIDANEHAIQEFCSEESKGNDLEDFARYIFKLNAGSQTSIQTLTSENSRMKEELEVINNAVKAYELDIKNNLSTIEELSKESEKYSEKEINFQNDLAASNNSRLVLEKQLSKLQDEITKMEEENKTLCCKIESLEHDHSLQVSSLQNDLKTTSEQLNALENEKCDLENSYKSSLESYKSEAHKHEILNEDFASLKCQLSKKEELLTSYEKIINDLKNQIKERELRFLEQESSLKLSLQNALDDNSTLKKSISTLDTQVKEFENNSLSTENAAMNLKSVLSLKEYQIEDLNRQINKLSEDIENTQINLKDNYEIQGVLESKLKGLIVCKQYFLVVLKTLLNSYQINFDISLFEVDDVSEQSVEEFFNQSNITDVITKQAFEQQSLTKLCSDLKEKLMVLESENSKLFEESITLRNIMTHTVQNNLKQQDSRLQILFSAFNEKEDKVSDLKSKVSLIKNSFQVQASRLHALELERDHFSNELEAIRKTLDNSEKTIQSLNEKNMAVEKNLLYASDLHKQRILELEAENRENISKNEYLQKELKENQTSTHAYVLEIQELQKSLQSKDRDIFEMGDELQAKCNSINSLTLDLETANSLIHSFQNEVLQLNKQIEKNAAESQILEAADNVSNGLQVEVEQLKNQLAFNEEQKNSLKQHIDNTDAQLHALMIEKSNVEQRLKDLELKLVDLTECNVNLSNTIEELNSTNLNYEQRCAEFANYKTLYEETLNEINSKSEKMKREIEEKESLLKENKILKNDNNNVISVLSKISNFFSETENLDCDPAPLTVHFEDENLISIFSQFLNKLVETKNCVINEKKMMQSAIETLENEKIQTESASKNISGSSNIEKISTVPPPIPPELHEEILCQQESGPSTLTLLENENKSLKQELNESKTKFSKSLEKLKLFKIKTDKLTNELKDLREKNISFDSLISQSKDREKELIHQLSLLNDEKESLLSNLKFSNESSMVELEKSKETIQKLKQQNSVLEVKSFKAQQDLEEYMRSWKELNVSFELQKEDNENLRSSVRKLSEQLEVSNSRNSDLNSNLMQLKMENLHFKQEAQNLKEHANMLLSDNDTYQTLIEKLKAAKSLSELKLLEAKEQFSAEMEALKSDHKIEIEKLMPEEDASISLITEECTSLKQKCTTLQHLNEDLQNEKDTYLRNLNLLEKEKIYLQQQLLEKNTELQNATSKLNDRTLLPNYDRKEENKFLLETSKLKEENELLKSQFSNLNLELNVCKENLSYFQNNFSSREAFYLDRINNLEGQLSEVKQKENFSDSKDNESELSQVLSSLHKQGVMCEELKTEVAKLLEERNMLRWQLQKSGVSNSGAKVDYSNPDDSSTELISVKVESSSSSEVASLHARLKESEKACQQLRQDNDALDRALNIERDKKRLIEEELHYAKEHLTEEAKASNEYQILIGDINEPEMVAETNFLISRNVRTHAYKFRRWLRGRRNYLCRTVKSRNYSQLGYLVYLCLIHVWLLMCVFS